MCAAVEEPGLVVPLDSARTQGTKQSLPGQELRAIWFEIGHQLCQA